VVIGAGLSGLQAAERTVERGHRVVVFESSDDVGGQLRTAAGLPFMSDFTKISDYLKGRLAHLKVDLRLRTTADMASLRMIGPDAIIVATGAKPWIPPIPGLDELAYDTIATFDPSRLAGPTLVVGGGIAGLAVALEVAARGFEVNLVEQGSAWGEGAATALSGRLIDELCARPSVIWHSQTTIERFGEDGVLLQKGGKRQTKALPAHIVIARGMQAETYLADQLTEGFTDIPVFRIGDCVAPRGMADAAFEGAAAAERL
jgi:NADPH-dependent 2,4-dienoyl-CoA reductase/sulfur reductase-like enzyme